MTKQDLISNLRVVPDFPIKGIQFFDVTTLFKDKDCLAYMLDLLYDEYKDKGITKIIGVESRGFLLGPALAARLGAGFVLARKKGKLPADTVSETYTKEYGSDTIEIHADAINENDVCIIHDDLLATGGTIAAVHRLVMKFKPKQTYLSFILDIKDCPKLPEFPAEVPCSALLDVREGA